MFKALKSGRGGWAARGRTGRVGLLLATAMTVATSSFAFATEKAAVLLPGSINDQSWNAQGYEGVKRLKAMGWDVAYSENVQPADMAQAMRDYAQRGYSVVIGHTGRFQSAAEAVAPRFPKTIFVVGSGSSGAFSFFRKPHTDHEPGTVYPRITRSGFWQRSWVPSGASDDCPIARAGE